LNIAILIPEEIENMLKQEIKEKILYNAIYLEEYGINDLAWKKENIKSLIQLSYWWP
jgi:hypothetical protein